MKDKLYSLPSTDLLPGYGESVVQVSRQELDSLKETIESVMAENGLAPDHIEAVCGPVVSLFKIYPKPNQRASVLRTFFDDFPYAFGGKRIRVYAEDGFIGLEVPNDTASFVPLRGLLESGEFRDSDAVLPVILGRSFGEAPAVIDLAGVSNLLVAGATKQGVYTAMDALMVSLLYSRRPEELKFVLIDPRMVNLTRYEGLKGHHLAGTPGNPEGGIIRYPDTAADILDALCAETDKRLAALQKREITVGDDSTPRIVTVFDEFSDYFLMPDRKLADRIRNSVIKLAQLGRAAGIHLVLLTQRPSVEVISAIVKANFPARLAFHVPGRVDSRAIIDFEGAERLLGKGDMLYQYGADIIRIQGAFVSPDQAEKVARFFESQPHQEPYILPGVPKESPRRSSADRLPDGFEDAARLVCLTQNASTSFLQRRLGYGYAHATRVMDALEMEGLVGPMEGTRPREVLVSDMESLEAVLSRLKDDKKL